MAFSAPLGYVLVSQMLIASKKTNHWISTYAELNGHGEEVSADFLGDSLASGNTWEVDEAGLNETLFALDSTEDLLSKSVGVG